jgi:hypothetical protein
MQGNTISALMETNVASVAENRNWQFLLTSSISSFSRISEAVYGLHGNVHLWPFINWSLLWIAMLKVWIVEQLGTRSPHVEFHQNLWNCLWVTWKGHFVALSRLCFIMIQYSWKSNCPTTFGESLTFITSVRLFMGHVENCIYWFM